MEQKRTLLKNKSFAILMVSSFIIMTIIVYGSSVLSYEFAKTDERGRVQANNTRIEIQERALTISALDIFLNNFLLGLPLILPVFGFIWFGRILINTGLTLGVLAYSFNVSPATYLIGAYIPIGFIETLAYSVLSAEGIMVLHSVIKQNLKHRLRKKTWKHLLLYFLLLLFGAILEIIIIRS